MSGISKRQVSRLCAEIDERVQPFLTGQLRAEPAGAHAREAGWDGVAGGGNWPYLWIDAT